MECRESNTEALTNNLEPKVVKGIFKNKETPFYACIDPFNWPSLYSTINAEVVTF